MTILDKLAAPFPPDAVSWRVGSTTADKSKGMALAYLDARDVMGRFDEVCGGFGWSSRHEVSPDGKKVTCHIGVRNPETGEWVWKSDGAGETDVEGEKGSYSDSLKRSAVAWGVGRYLYGLASPWVELEQRGRTHVIKASEQPKLRRALMAGEATPQPQPDQEPAGKSPRDLAYEYGNSVIKQVNSIKTEKYLDDYLKTEAKSPQWADMAVNHPDLLAIVRKAVVGKRTDLNDGRDVAA